MELASTLSMMQFVTPFSLWLMIVGFAVTAIILAINRKLALNAKKMVTHSQRKQAHTQILELLFANAPLPEILDAVVKSIELQDAKHLCSILLVSKDGKRLRVAAAPHLPDYYSKALDGIEIGPQACSCGTCAYTGRRVFIENILLHPLWSEYKRLASQAGLVSCWSEPIKSSNGKV